jgi:hypothetical protein
MVMLLATGVAQAGIIFATAGKRKAAFLLGVLPLSLGVLYWCLTLIAWGGRFEGTLLRFYLDHWYAALPAVLSGAITVLLAWLQPEPKCRRVWGGGPPAFPR